jgi:uncharacterized protein (UPF0128 family)
VHDEAACQSQPVDILQMIVSENGNQYVVINLRTDAGRGNIKRQEQQLLLVKTARYKTGANPLLVLHCNLVRIAKVQAICTLK